MLFTRPSGDSGPTKRRWGIRCCRCLASQPWFCNATLRTESWVGFLLAVRILKINQMGNVGWVIQKCDKKLCETVSISKSLQWTEDIHFFHSLSLSVIGWGLRYLANKLIRWNGESHLAWQISHNSPGAAGSWVATEGTKRGQAANSFSLPLPLSSILSVIYCGSCMVSEWLSTYLGRHRCTASERVWADGERCWLMVPEREDIPLPCERAFPPQSSAQSHQTHIIKPFTLFIHPKNEVTRIVLVIETHSMICLNTPAAITRLALVTDGSLCWALNDCSHYHLKIWNTMTNVACRETFVWLIKGGFNL